MTGGPTPRTAPTRPQAQSRPTSRPARLSVLRCLLLLALVGLGCAEDPAIAWRERSRAVVARLTPAYVFIGGGSGVIIRPDGLMVTNHHVAGEQADWQVRLADGRQFKAEMLGVDPVGDLAVLKLQAEEELPWVRLATASELTAGVDALAIGNPFGLGNQDHTPTVSLGVVSEVRLVRGNYTDCIWTDTPLNPGNSGGPLFDMQGRLLGINGQIRTRSGLRINSGIGLAIASTQVADFLPFLENAAGGFVHHSAAPEGLSWETREDGVYLTEVPETCAPFLPGDRLLRIDDRPVTSAETAGGIFAARAWFPELSIAVEALRDGATIQGQVPSGKTPIPGRPWHGLRLQVRDGQATVRKVDPGSPAEKAGITVGMIIERVNDRPINGTIDLLKALVGRGIGDPIVVRTGGDQARDFHFSLDRRR